MEIYPVDSVIHLLNNWCWVRKDKLDQGFVYGQVHTAPDDRLKNLTGHFVHMGPFNVFALFTWNFETSKFWYG